MIVEVLLVEQFDGGVQVQPAVDGWIQAAAAVQSFGVAHQDAQRTFGRGGGDADRNPAHDPLASVGAQHSFNGDFFTGTGFRHIRAGALHHGGAAVFFQIKLQRYAADGGRLEGIVIDASEVVAQGNSHGKGSRHVFRGREHVGEPHVGKSADMDMAVHAVGGFFAILVHPLQSIEDRGHHHQRSQPGVVKHFVMELFGPAGSVNVERDRNHLRLLIEAPQDAGVPVLDECPNGLSGVDDLEGVERRGQSRHHVGLGHGHLHHAVLGDGMAAGQQVLFIHVGDGAGGRSVHVSAHQHCAYYRSGNNGLRLFHSARPPHTHDRSDSRSRKLIGKRFD